MNNKKLLILSLPILLLSSCNKTPSLGKDYKVDLLNLVNGPYVTKNDISKYDITCREDTLESNGEQKYVYTVKISYIDTTLNGFRAILLPKSNISNYETSNLANVGYYSIMNLVAVRENNSKTNYPQFKLQMEKNEKQDSIYVYVGYGNTYDLIKFDREF